MSLFFPLLAYQTAVLAHPPSVLAATTVRLSQNAHFGATNQSTETTFATDWNPSCLTSDVSCLSLTSQALFFNGWTFLFWTFPSPKIQNPWIGWTTTEVHLKRTAFCHWRCWHATASHRFVQDRTNARQPHDSQRTFRLLQRWTFGVIHHP